MDNEKDLNETKEDNNQIVEQQNKTDSDIVEVNNIKTESLEIRCLNCGTPLKETDDFCPKCGIKKGESKKYFCKKCNSEIEIGQKFCPKCGEKTEFDAKEYVDSIKNNYSKKMNTINFKKIGIIVAIVFLAIGLLFFICSLLFQDYHKYVEICDYQKAYSVANNEDKKKVYLEDIIFKMCKEVRSTYKDPSSFELREVYYNDIIGSVALKTGGKNSYGGIVFSYQLFLYNEDSGVFKYSGSESSLEDEKTYSWDDSDEKLEKLYSNMTKKAISLCIGEDFRIDDDIIDDINLVFSSGNYKNAILIDEETEKNLNHDYIKMYNISTDNNDA